MVCNIYDYDMTLKGTIFTWVSLVWDEYYNEVGEAQIELQLTDGMAELVTKDRYMSITGSNHFMLIKSVFIENNKLVANAKDAICILDERVSTETVGDEDGEVAIRKLITDMEPWPNFELGSSAGIGETYTGQIENGTVLDYVLDIAQALDIGLSVTYSKESKKLVFECYKPTADAHSKYSTMYSNMSNISYSVSSVNYKNVAVVRGKQKTTGSDGSTSTDQPVYVTTGDTSATGTDRREIFVDATSENMEDGESLTEYQSRLARYGLQKLAEQVTAESVSFTVGEGVEIGEVITCIVPEFNLKLQTRIMAIKMTSQNNATTREVEVGTPVITRRR